MRLLYVASDQVVPGHTGGSVHVLEVARGLAARGHEVHAVVKADAGRPATEASADGRVVLHRIRWTPFQRFFRFRAEPQVAALIETLKPDAIMERYYNFGGEGVRAGAAHGLPVLLEVNAPVVDHPGSLKGTLDALLVMRPMRRYRERLCGLATALVAPLVEIVPEFARTKTEVVTWGANVDAFTPERRRADVRRELGVPDGAVAVIFSSSFRPWHGAHVLRAAARALRAHSELYFVLVGGERSERAREFNGIELGPVPYERMPEIVAASDIGVAPYDTARLAQLSLGFFWSPLKVFEYMASGLPTVTIARPPLDEIVRPEQEGLVMQDGDPKSLAQQLLRLAADPLLRQRLGAAARTRVVARYSWACHCAQLERVLSRIAA
jgi:glycosyltransferase involved in cell wall biosynthesis